MVGKLNIVLNIDGKDIAFTPKFLSGMAFRKIFDVKKLFEKGEDMTGEDMDEAVDYVANTLFNGQFTVEQYYNGLPLEDVFSTTMDLLGEVSEVATSKLKNSSPVTSVKRKKK